MQKLSCKYHREDNKHINQHKKFTINHGFKKLQKSIFNIFIFVLVTIAVTQCDNSNTNNSSSNSKKTGAKGDGEFQNSAAIPPGLPDLSLGKTDSRLNPGADNPGG